jgi:hypothetical protein
MAEQTAIKLFENTDIRVLWDNEAEKWWFSVIDVLAVLTESDNPRKYWSVLKTRLNAEGNQTATNCSQLKMRAADGKMRLTDAADAEQLLRLIQSIPSPKAEPFKLWLARVGSERLDEIEDPELAINRALETYARKGYSLEWINQRLKTIEVRKDLTDEWDKRGIQKGKEYAILTDEITRAWPGMRTRQYKDLKGLHKENLRDNMTNGELILNMLAEYSAMRIAKKEKPEDFDANLKVAARGGLVAAKARRELEAQAREPVITGKSARNLVKPKK